ADFDDVVDAVLLGEAPDFFIPIGRLLVVDRGPGAELAGAREFVIAAGGDDHAGAGGVRELQGEDGDAAGAKGEDGLTSLQVAASEEGVPGGDGGAGRRGGFFEREIRGCGDETLLGIRDVFAQPAVDGAAAGAVMILESKWTGEPVAEEDAGDAIADFPARDA